MQYDMNREIKNLEMNIFVILNNIINQLQWGNGKRKRNKI